MKISAYRLEKNTLDLDFDKLWWEMIRVDLGIEPDTKLSKEEVSEMAYSMLCNNFYGYLSKLLGVEVVDGGNIYLFWDVAKPILDNQLVITGKEAIEIQLAFKQWMLE